MEEPIFRTKEVTVIKTVKYWDCMSKNGRCKVHHQSRTTAEYCSKRNSEPYEIFINDEERTVRNRDIFDAVIRRGETMTSSGKKHHLSVTTIRSIVRSRMRHVHTIKTYNYNLKEYRKLFENPDEVDAEIMNCHVGFLESKRQNSYWTIQGAHCALAFIGLDARERQR